jgi:hypothetical protein
MSEIIESDRACNSDDPTQLRFHPRLRRETFRTSRLLDFASEKELIAQIGHRPAQWPLVIVKELTDNALDAAEEADIAPEVSITIDKTGITVADNGLGLPAATVEGVLDFAVRVSSREAYVSPTRGAQGNALKTIVVIPFVRDGERGSVEIEARGVRHEIEMSVDRVCQEPVVSHRKAASKVERGTVIRVPWEDLSRAQFDDPELEDEAGLDDDSPIGYSSLRGVEFYKSRPTTPGSTPTPASLSTGTASAPRSRRPTRRGASGSRSIRRRRAGTASTTSSGWSAPTSSTTPTTAASAPCARWWRSSAA